MGLEALRLNSIYKSKLAIQAGSEQLSRNEESGHERAQEDTSSRSIDKIGSRDACKSYVRFNTTC